MIFIHEMHKNNNELKQYPVEQGHIVTFNFPKSLNDSQIKDFKEGKAIMNPGCSCTSYKVLDSGSVVFNVKAPEFAVNLEDFYLKTVEPSLRFENGDTVIWKIRFFVNYKKSDKPQIEKVKPNV